ncbi:MAG: citrate transporter [Clostridia bacterium]|nr:citrate transporter [Clostridia bacterium]
MGAAHVGRFVSDFIKKNTVLCIAFVAALVTSVIVKPDASECVSYIDFKTISCLFATLAVVCALKNIGFFTKVSHVIIEKTGNLRLGAAAVIFITYFGSMLIANDMALLTFLPLGYIVLKETHNEKYMAFVFVMQNIAANLGGMLTPFGNPQNLYLYSKFNISTGEFFLIMLRPFVIATVLIGVCCLLVKSEPMKLDVNDGKKLPGKRTAIYIVLFVLSIAIVFRVVHYVLGLAVILAAMLFLDRSALKKVDYPLLLTFVCFFIFAGNMSRIGVVNDVMSWLMEKNTLLFSALSCQVISNVPSAVLLSQFTGNYAELLLGVNIGGAGTLIASLASLITFREYSSHNPQKVKSYIGIFSALNFGFLFLLLAVEMIF